MRWFALLLCLPAVPATAQALVHLPYDHTSEAYSNVVGAVWNEPASGGPTTLFDAPFLAEFVRPGLWSVPDGPAAPDEAFYPDDYDGALGYTTAIFTRAGTPDIVASPICSGTDCLNFAQFNAAASGDYFQAPSTSEFAIGASDATLCWVAGGNGLYNRLLSSRAAGAGFELVSQGARLQLQLYDGTSSASIDAPTNSQPADALGSISAQCAMIDYDGTTEVCTFDSCGAAVATPNAGPITNNHAMYVGRRSYGPTGYLNGYLGPVLMWHSLLSDDEYKAVLRGLLGYASAVGEPMTFTRASVTMGEDADGQWHRFPNDVPAITHTGIAVAAGRTNHWTDWLDLSAATDGNTPTITTDTASGPFSLYNNGPEADTIEDDNAGGWDCKYIVATAGPSDTWTVSYWLKEGSTDKARLLIYDNAGGTAQECLETVTSAWARYTCTGTLDAGAVTSVRGYICPGNASADVGTIIVSGAQLEEAATAFRPCPTDGGAAATCAGDAAITLDVDTVVGQTVYEFDFTPFRGGNYTRPLFYAKDSSAGATNYWYFYQYASTFSLRMRSTEEGAERVVWSFNTGIALGTAHHFRIIIGGSAATSLVEIDDVEKTLSAGVSCAAPDNIDWLRLGNYATSLAWGDFANLEITQ